MGSSSRASWLRLSIVLDEPDIETAERLLSRAGAVGFSFEDAGNAPVLEPEPGAAPLWPKVVLTALFPAATELAPIAAALAARFGMAAAPMIEPLDPADCVPRPSALETPLEIGGRLLIGTPQTAAVPSRSLLRLTGGLAFGTGTHPTTRLCLDWLEREVAAGAQLLDYGCGSGILGLAALALGAGQVWAVDIEPQALIATRDNAELNDFDERIWIGAPQALPRISTDIVVANILAGPLEALADTLTASLRPGGTLVMSGILDHQCERLEHAYRPHLERLERAHRDGWARLSGRRRAGAV